MLLKKSKNLPMYCWCNAMGNSSSGGRCLTGVNTDRTPNELMSRTAACES
jgi:hypothetical protein